METNEYQRFFIHLAYKGTNYHGWQIQPNAVTIQQTLNEALSVILREEINLVGAGRTDAGVHASSFFAHFDLKPRKDLDINHLVFKLNCYLPRDIAIYNIYPVHGKAHARFDATSRTYQYYIFTRKDPFNTDTSYFLFKEVNVEKMNEACSLLQKYKDFTSFSKRSTETKTNLCDIYRVEWIKKGSKLIFTIEANRFLRNMVRALVGTMLEIGEGKLSLEEFTQIIEKKDRTLVGYSIPANGLFLTEIQYPKTIIDI
ncbi:MAG: tRNA pseudouridine(38-40) synthase TruA [Bacteroidota bacterium]